MTRALRQEVDAAGVLRVTLDVPGAAVNTLSPALIDEFDALLGQLEAGPASTRAVVLASAKRDNFVAGADIKQFEQLGSAAEGEALSRTAQALLDRLEALRLPVVAAVHGSCLGGGLELALACRCRIASSDPKTTLGAPEVMLGLIPGAGGTQRLPRLVGLVRSLDLILTGRSLRPAAAHRAGLVDRVVPAAALLEEAHRVALALAEGRPWLSRGGLRLAERLLRGWILRRARGRVRKRTGAHYPAPFRAIEVVGEGLARGQAAGLRLEAKRFGELAASDVSQALVSIFLASQAIKKDSGVPADTAVRETRRLGVLGAGLMGAGISAAAARAGVAVRLKDTGAEALGRGLRHVRGVFEQRRRRGRLSRRELEQYMDRVAPTVQMTGFGRADVIIEAVFEDLDLKRRVLAETEEVVSEECVLASNTSSLPIAEIARDAQRPSRVLGMHFFSPVEKMPLLEIVVTPATDATATATAVALGRRLGKHVIVVRDGPGFYTTRTLAAYLNEAGRLLEDGATVEQVDSAMTAFGFPVGPLTLLDEVGIDVGAKVATVLHARLGERMAPPESMQRVVEDGRLGRKNKRGFYSYEGRRKRVDGSVYGVVPVAEPRRSMKAEELRERLVLAFLNEAVFCLQDDILRSARDGDVGAVFGLGYPPFLGGPFRDLDRRGARAVVEGLEDLARKHGERFRPAPLLVDQARSGRRFHG